MGVGGRLIVVLFIVSWLLRLGAPGHVPGAAAFILAIAGVALAMVTRWLGGELVDRLGIGVDPGAHPDASSSLSGQPAETAETPVPRRRGAVALPPVTPFLRSRNALVVDGPVEWKIRRNRFHGKHCITWAARQIPIKAGQMFSLSGTLATMANGLPYTIGAQVAHPDRQCIAFVGDGGFSMLMAEFSTAVKYKLPIKVFVIKNNVLGMIRWEQMVMLGNPEYGVTLEPIDFAGFARVCGGTGLTVEDPGECGHVVDQALRTPGPVLVEAVVDPFEPPMPPKISMDQSLKFGKALARGEPNREKIVLTVASDKVRELI